jgi:hypothetical protein
MTKTKASAHAIADVSPQELEKRVREIERHLDAIDALMADAVELSDAERRVALRLQGADEVTALGGVLDFAEARPALFASLANEDDGNDPAVFETKLLRGRLANASVLRGLLDRIDETRGAVSDSALYVATLAKRPLLAAYQIAKPHQGRDRECGKALNAAVDLYRAHSLAAAKTRRQKNATT